jgi:hypothetical protein
VLPPAQWLVPLLLWQAQVTQQQQRQQATLRVTPWT